MKPRAFIASSSLPGSMQIARAVDTYLHNRGVLTRLWNQVFSAETGKQTLEVLENQTDVVDFAVFILAPDDLLLKSKPIYTTRDNVIFELGLFVKALGMDRCFVITPEKREDLHLLTDLQGVTFLTYDSKELGYDESDLVKRSGEEICARIQKKGPREKNKFRMLFGVTSPNGAIKREFQAVVVYPRIVCNKLLFRIHHGPTAYEQFEVTSIVDHPSHFDTVAHFDDLRAVSGIAELCGSMGGTVIATRDGMEQDVLQKNETISFSIGMINGYTYQALQVIKSETKGKIRIELSKPSAKKIVIYFDGKSYETPPDPNISQNSNEKNYAILVRTFLGKGKQAVPRFICAGLDSFGTFAAGKYLKDRWEVLLKYYEDCHKDLNEYSLAILLSFLGQKIDSADLWVENLCFFCKKGDCTFYFFDSNDHPTARPVKPDQCPNFPECVERYNKGAKKDRCPLIPDGSVIEDCPLIQQYVNVENTG